MDRCISTEIPLEDLRDVQCELGSKVWYEWKQSEDLMEEFIVIINVWYENGRRVRCKVLEML